MIVEIKNISCIVRMEKKKIKFTLRMDLLNDHANLYILRSLYDSLCHTTQIARNCTT